MVADVLIRLVFGGELIRQWRVRLLGRNDIAGGEVRETRPGALEFQPSLPPTAGGRAEIIDEGTYDMVKDTHGFQSHCVDSSVHTKRPRRGKEEGGN